MDLLDSGRGLALFQHDIDRLLAKYTPAAYKDEPNRALRLAAVSDRPKGGRRITITAEVARSLGVSIDTIQRREGELIAEGHIRREITADHQRSFVILSPFTWDVNAQTIEMPNGADATLPTRAAGQAGAKKTTGRRSGRRGAQAVCQPVTSTSRWMRKQ